MVSRFVHAEQHGCPFQRRERASERNGFWRGVEKEIRLAAVRFPLPRDAIELEVSEPGQRIVGRQRHAELVEKRARAGVAHPEETSQIMSPTTTERMGRQRDRAVLELRLRGGVVTFKVNLETMQLIDD